MWLLNGFRDTILQCGISDFPMKGHPYTWERSQDTVRWVKERLDRVFVNEDWKVLILSYKVQKLIAPSSDHSANFLQVSMWRPVSKCYRFRLKTVGFEKNIVVILLWRAGKNEKPRATTKN